MSGVFQRTVTDGAGNALAGATVEVRHQSSNVLATIHSTFELDNPKSNPFQADAEGFAKFFAANGLYRIVATKGEFSREWTHEPIGQTLTGDFSETLSDLASGISDNAQEISDNIADIDRAAEVAIENAWRLFRLGRPAEDYKKFQLEPHKVLLAPGITLKHTVDTIQENATLSVQSLALIGALNEAGSAFIFDLDTVNVGATESLGERLVQIGADLGENSANIASETMARVSEDEAIASLIMNLDASLTSIDGTVNGHSSAISALESTVTEHTGTISSHASQITALQAAIELVDPELGGVAEALEALEASITQNAEDIEAVATDVTSLDTRLGTAESDIGINASAISGLGSTVSSQGGLITAAAADITALQASVSGAEEDIDANASAISGLSATVSSQGGTISSLSSSVSSLSSTVGGHTSSISSISSTLGTVSGDVTTLNARHGVAIDIDGNVSGFQLFSNGTTSEFDIVANKFRIVDPGNGLSSPAQVFAVSGGIISAQNMRISGSLLVGGTVPAGKLDVGDLSNIFPDDHMQGNLDTGWTVEAAPSTYAFLPTTQTNANAFSRGSIRLNGAVAGHQGILSPQFAVEPGATYYLSCFAGAQNGEAQTTNCMSIVHFRWIDNAGSTLGHTAVASSVATYTTPTVPNIVGRVTAPAGAVRSLIYFQRIGDAAHDRAVFSSVIVRRAVTGVLIADGAVTADKLTVSSLSAITADLGTITAGTITLPSGGHVKSGQSAYDTGTGFFLGNVSSVPVFSIGNSAGNKLIWDGTNLNVVGAVNATNSAQTFSPSWTGFDAFAPPSGDISYIDFGAYVMMFRSSDLTGTSNTGSMTFTGVPGAIQPGSARTVGCQVVNGANTILGRATISGGTVTFSTAHTGTGTLITYSTTSFGSGVPKGIPGGWMLIYPK